MEAAKCSIVERCIGCYCRVTGGCFGWREMPWPNSGQKSFTILFKTPVLRTGGFAIRRHGGVNGQWGNVWIGRNNIHRHLVARIMVKCTKVVLFL